MRAKGYVVGHDTKNGELVWTVKVKDEKHPDSGKKFPVASLHLGTMLTKPGVDVTFEIEDTTPWDWRAKDTQGFVATDVSLGKNFPEDHAVKENPDKSMSFALVEENGKIYSWYNECETEDECREWLEEQSDGCRLVAFLKINASAFGKDGTHGDYEDARAFFEGLQTMMKEVDSASHALSSIVTEAFLLGMKTKTTINP